MKEFNEKLALWAGFRYVNDDSGHYSPYWKNPVNNWVHRHSPDFSESLDDCYKWLVPKLQYMGYVTNLICYEESGARADIDSVLLFEEGFDASNNSPALALCLAIEKLIDKEK